MNKILRDKIIIFTLGIFTTTLLLIFILFPKKEISDLEKRKLEQVPKFSLQNFLKGYYQKNLEKSLSDNFFKREFFVGLNSYKNLLMKKMDQSNIYHAKDGFLIRKPAKKDFSNFSKNLDIINDFSNKINSKMSVMIVPSAGYVMENKLNFLHEEYFDKEFLDFFEKNKENKINFIRLDDLFLKEREKNLLFYKTDHHWTSKGAFISCNKYFGQNNMELLKEKDFLIEKYKNFYGTSYSSSGFWLTKPDEIELFNSEDIKNLQIKNKENSIKNDVFSKNFLETHDKYSVFLGGNYKLIEIYNKNCKNNENLLIIKDSFANCIAPFLSLKYKHTYTIDLRFYKECVSDFISKKNIGNILVLYSFENVVSDFNIKRLKGHVTK